MFHGYVRELLYVRIANSKAQVLTHPFAATFPFPCLTDISLI